MEKVAQDPIRRLITLMEQISRDLRSRDVPEWSDIELTMPQVRVLMLLNQRPQRVGDLADQLGTALPSTTTMIDRLVNKDLVQRTHDAEDRRVVTCSLTERGSQEAERIWRLGQLRIEEAASFLRPEELETVVHAMEIMAAAIRRGQKRSENASTEHSTGRRTEGGAPSCIS